MTDSSVSCLKYKSQLLLWDPEVTKWEGILALGVADKGHAGL